MRVQDVRGQVRRAGGSWHSCGRRDAKRPNQFHKFGVDSLRRLNFAGMATLIEACKACDYERIGQLLGKKSHPSIDIDFQDESGKTAAMYLAAVNADNALALLLSRRPNLALGDEDSQTALHIAG